MLETHPLLPEAAEDVTEITGDTYGPLKVTCERIVRDAYGIVARSSGRRSLPVRSIRPAGTPIGSSAPCRAVKCWYPAMAPTSCR